jgi:1,4-dihydroxy-2-naphthoate polyprenyltransferase
LTAEIAPQSPTLGQWIAGARPRTLPAAVSPVVAASGIAFFEGAFSGWRALLALIVGVSLQVGVNYANDYSDGIRGTDAVRIGPLRLVGSGLARPGTVKTAAFACFAVSGMAGVVLVWAAQQWWLLPVGAAAILAAWYYTGGKRPYGYLGLGEVAVFVFFGLVATCGTGYVQTGRVSLPLFMLGIGVGALACAILVANNLRDIEGDQAAGKLTLATRIGDPATRTLYLMLVILAALMIITVAVFTSWWALSGLVGLLLIIPAVRVVVSGGRGRDLITVLKVTGLAELVACAALAAGLVVAGV